MHKTLTLFSLIVISLVYGPASQAASTSDDLGQIKALIDTQLTCHTELLDHSTEPENEKLLAQGLFEAVKHGHAELVLYCLFGIEGVENDYLIMNRHGYAISKKNLVVFLKQASASGIKPYRLIVGAKIRETRSLLSDQISE